MAGQTATFVNRPKWGANYPPESVARSKRQGSINVVYIPDRISHCPTISGGTNHFAGQITRRRKADRLWAINPRKPSTNSRRRSRPKSTNQNSRSSRLCSRNNPAIKSSRWGQLSSLDTFHRPLPPPPCRRLSPWRSRRPRRPMPMV